MLLGLVLIMRNDTAGVFTIAVNTGPLPDEALLSRGANLLFHSMQEFCDEWEDVYEELKG